MAASARRVSPELKNSIVDFPNDRFNPDNFLARILAESRQRDGANQSSGEEALRLLEKTLLALEHLYQMNSELEQSLEKARGEMAVAETHAKKWENLANIALERAKSLEKLQSAQQSRAERAEGELERADARASAVEQKVITTQNELSTYRERLVGFFKSNPELREAIDSVKFKSALGK